MVREYLKLDSKNQFFNKWKKENWKDKLQNAYKSSSFHEKARFLSNCPKKWDFYVPRKKRIFCVIKLFCLQTHFPRFYGNQCSDSAAKDCFEMNVPLQTTFVRPFWPFFRHITVWTLLHNQTNQTNCWKKWNFLGFWENSRLVLMTPYVLLSFAVILYQ